jgi:arsenite methyltransferase
VGALLIAAFAIRRGATAVAFIATIAAVVSGGIAIAMIYTSKVAKLRERDRILDLAELQGDEVVLDVGCGRGLLLVEAARRLPAGEAVGVDLWRAKDQSANTPAGPLHNARAVGVKVQVETADARDLPFDDDTFDVVVSSLALHNISGVGARRVAVREIARVLKPRGRLVLVDIARTDEYVTALRGVGWRDVDRSELLFRMFPPIRYVIGTKPAR